MPGREDVDADPRAALDSLAINGAFVATPAMDLLFQFADGLIRWNQSINLTGAKSVGAVVTERYPDALPSPSDSTGRRVW